MPRPISYAVVCLKKKTGCPHGLAGQVLPSLAFLRGVRQFVPAARGPPPAPLPFDEVIAHPLIYTLSLHDALPISLSLHDALPISLSLHDALPSVCRMTF